MPCYHPLEAWFGRKVGGKRQVVFKRSLASPGSALKSFSVPCGRCIGCRLERSRQWAVRIMHEASQHADNCFLTLTYASEQLPTGGSLQLSDFQKFFKRLRKRVGKPLRFFHCGEYGEALERPHYHVCLFGYGFPDKVPWSTTPRGDRLYVSEELAKLWPHGFSTIGELTFDSAAYTAAYCLKKITGPAAEGHYSGRSPEYVTMSRRPGLGAGWYDRFKSDVYPAGRVVVRGHECAPPRFYDSKFELDNPLEFTRMKLRRASAVDLMDNDSFRLPVKEKVRKSRTSILERKYEKKVEAH